MMTCFVLAPNFPMVDHGVWSLCTLNVMYRRFIVEWSVLVCFCVDKCHFFGLDRCFRGGGGTWNERLSCVHLRDYTYHLHYRTMLGTHVQFVRRYS